MQKYLVLPLLLSLTLILNGQKADSDTSQTETKYYTFNFYLFNGYGMSYNLCEFDNSIVKLHIDFNNSYSNTDSESKYSYIEETYNDGNIRSNKNINDGFDVSLSPIYLYKIYKSELGYAYLGGGPEFGYSSYCYETEGKEKNIASSVITDGTVSKNERYEIRYTIGAVFIAGIKAQITSHFGIFIESHLDAGYLWGKNKSKSKETYQNGITSIYKNEGDSNGWSQNFELSRIGVSISI